MANNAIQQDQLDYVKKSKVTTMLSGMMQQVILAQPEDPLTFLQELLTKPDGRGEEEQATLLKEIHNAVDKHAGGALVRWHLGTARACVCVCVCVCVSCGAGGSWSLCRVPCVCMPHLLPALLRLRCCVCVLCVSRAGRARIIVNQAYPPSIHRSSQSPSISTV